MKQLIRVIIILWFKKEATKAAPTILINHYDGQEIREIIKGFWKKYLLLKKELPVMPTLGGAITIRLAAMSRAFHEELTERNQKEIVIAQLFYQIGWVIYQKMGKFSWSLTRLSGKNEHHRLLKATQLFRKFPFNEPEYKWENVETSDNIIGFNCTKCPVAEYFVEHDLSDFCTKTWCALDFPIAELWNAKLERTGSIASGAMKCDFRWISKAVNT
jgi:hypothetical protein